MLRAVDLGHPTVSRTKTSSRVKESTDTPVAGGMDRPSVSRAFKILLARGKADYLSDILEQVLYHHGMDTASIEDIDRLVSRREEIKDPVLRRYLSILESNRHRIPALLAKLKPAQTGAQSL